MPKYNDAVINFIQYIEQRVNVLEQERNSIKDIDVDKKERKIANEAAVLELYNAIKNLRDLFRERKIIG